MSRLAVCLRYSDDWWEAYLWKLNQDTARTLFRNAAAMGWIATVVSWFVAWVLR